MPLLQRLPNVVSFLVMWLATFVAWMGVRTLMSLDANPLHGAIWSAILAGALWHLFVRKR